MDPSQTRLFGLFIANVTAYKQRKLLATVHVCFGSRMGDGWYSGGNFRFTSDCYRAVAHYRRRLKHLHCIVYVLFVQSWQVTNTEVCNGAQMCCRAFLILLGLE